MNHTKSQNPWIAGLSSFVLHLGVLLLLAFWTIAELKLGSQLTIDSGVTSDETSVVFTVETDAQPSDENSESMAAQSVISSSTLVSDEPPSLEVTPGDAPTASQTILDAVTQSSSESKSVGSAFVGSSVEGRTTKNRLAIGERNGASAASEAAVEAALAYLARHQNNNGSWTLLFEDGPCKGECDHGGIGKDPHETAATGLALLCFLGAGHTMHSGEYSEQVAKGIYFLIQSLRQSQSGRSSWLTPFSRFEMYEHGIASLALCEALQMTGDVELLAKPCQEVINYIIVAQTKGGGWDYHSTNKAEGDLSIVGWQVMALKSAFAAKLNVNAETIRNLDQFLKEHSSGDFKFVYHKGSKPTANMTAIGSLMRIIRGRSLTDPSNLKAADYLTKEGLSPTDIYFDYYATQVLFQTGGKQWKDWNVKMRDYLVATQENDGHSAGSWWFNPKGKDLAVQLSNNTGGRIYTTALACLTLEVYYRYLPVYNPTDDQFKF